MKDKKNSLFTKAKFVQGRRRWYIYFKQTNPETNELKIFKPTFDLNYIKDVSERKKRFLEKVKEVNQLLPTGYPFEVQSPKAKYDALVEQLKNFLLDINKDKERKKVLIPKAMAI